MARALFTKCNAFRADVNAQDWEDDKAVSFNSGGRGSGYKFLSMDKVNRQIAPLLVKHGLEINPGFTDLTYNAEANKWTVRCTTVYTDMDTGYSTSNSAYGEGSGEKAVTVAETLAYKKTITTKFMLVDGIEDYEDMPSGRTFVKKTPEEEDEIKSQILSNAVKPEPKAEAKPKPKAKKESPAAALMDEPAVKAEEPKAEDKDKDEVEVKPAEAPKAPASDDLFAGFVPAKPQQNVIRRILEGFETKANEGVIDAGYVDVLKAQIAAFKEGKDVIAFIKEHRE